MIRVLIVDDQLPFREASRMVVELTDGFEVAGEAEAIELANSTNFGLHSSVITHDRARGERPRAYPDSNGCSTISIVPP